MVIVHAPGVHRPPVLAHAERDIGFKRSSDGWAHTPRQDSSSGNPALLIGSGSYGCPILQRFRICTACSVCSCPLQLSHPGRLITQEYLFNSSCFQQGYHNAPHGAHRTGYFRIIRLSGDASFEMRYCFQGPSVMNVLVTRAADNQGFTMTCRHCFDPGWFLCPPIPFEVFQRSDMVDFNGRL